MIGTPFRVGLFARNILFLVSGLLTPLCLAASNSPNPNIEPLLAQLQQLRQENHIPVLGLILFEDDHDSPYGVKTTMHTLGAPSNTPFRWGSITKSVTALTMHAALKSRNIPASTAVASLLDQDLWHNPWAATHPLRVLHLLELTGGLPDLSAAEFSFNQPVELTAALAINPSRRTLLWPPGMHHSYSNLSPGLTQAVLAALTKQSFQASVKEYVFTPLGMHSASFDPQISIGGVTLPGGFKADGKTSIPYWHMTFPAYGALNASLTDMGKLFSAIFARVNPPLSSSQYQFLFVGQTTLAARSGFTFNYASGLYPRVRNERVWWGHGGDADGYRSRLAYLRDHRRGYLVVINTDNPAALRDIELSIERFLSRSLPLAPEPQKRHATITELSQLAGRYTAVTSRFPSEQWLAGRAPEIRITVTENHQQLLFSRGQRQIKLLPVGTSGLRQFRREHDPVATVVFVADQGRMYLQGELGNFVRSP